MGMLHRCLPQHPVLAITLLRRQLQNAWPPRRWVRHLPRKVQLRHSCTRPPAKPWQYQQRRCKERPIMQRNRSRNHHWHMRLQRHQLHLGEPCRYRYIILRDHPSHILLHNALTFWNDAGIAPSARGSVCTNLGCCKSTVSPWLVSLS